MKNQFLNMSNEMLEMWAEHHARRMEELIARNAPQEFIDRLDAEQNDIYDAMFKNTKK